MAWLAYRIRQRRGRANLVIWRPDSPHIVIEFDAALNADNGRKLEIKLGVRAQTRAAALRPP